MRAFGQLFWLLMIVLSSILLLYAISLREQFLIILLTCNCALSAYWFDKCAS